MRRSSASGSSVANLRFSKLILSLGLWFQANSTASWKVVTSRSYWPTSFLKVIWRNNTLFGPIPRLQQATHLSYSQQRKSEGEAICISFQVNRSMIVFLCTDLLNSQCRWTWGGASEASCRCGSSYKSLLPLVSNLPALWAERQKPSRCSSTTLQHSGSLCWLSQLQRNIQTHLSHWLTQTVGMP